MTDARHFDHSRAASGTESRWWFARLSCRRRTAALLVALTVALVSGNALASHQLRLGTLAPKQSSWGKVFSVWEKALAKKSNGELELDIYYNGVQGMESAMVAKMKTGQLDGAALSGLGLMKIDNQVLVMSLPWMIDSWKKLDAVRSSIAPEFERAFEKKGFDVLGWGDVGLVYAFSKGFAPRKPADLRGRRPMIWRNEPVGPLLFSTIGGVTPVPAGPMEVVTKLRSGTVDMISAPALAAEQLQWVPHLDHVSDQPSGCAIAATVFTSRSLQQLPADLHELLIKMQRVVGRNQSQRIRKLDAEAIVRIRKRMTVVSLSEAERAAWKGVARNVLRRLGQGTYPRPLMERVAKLAGFSTEDW